MSLQPQALPRTLHFETPIRSTKETRTHCTHWYSIIISSLLSVPGEKLTDIFQYIAVSHLRIAHNEYNKENIDIWQIKLVTPPLCCQNDNKKSCQLNVGNSLIRRYAYAYLLFYSSEVVNDFLKTAITGPNIVALIEKGTSRTCPTYEMGRIA